MAKMQNRGRQDDRRKWDISPEQKIKISSWIKEGFNRETLKYAEDFGEYLVKNRLTTSQIRIIYGEVKRIEGSINMSTGTSINSKDEKDFLLLRPKIAYAAKRAGTFGIEALKEVMDIAHDAVNLNGELITLQKQVENFADFFEAILAYHKAAGGRE